MPEDAAVTLRLAVPHDAHALTALAQLDCAKVLSACGGSHGVDPAATAKYVGEVVFLKGIRCALNWVSSGRRASTTS